MKRSADFRVRKSKLGTKRTFGLTRTKKLDGLSLRSILMDRFLNAKLRAFFSSVLGKLIIGAFLLFVLLFLAYTLLLSSRFKTQTVILYEGDAVSANTEYQHLASQFRGRQLLTISESDVLDTFLLNGVNLKGLKVEKNYPNTLVIYIEPLPIAFEVSFVKSDGTLLTENKFALNTAGILTDQSKITENTAVLEIVPFVLEDPKKGDHFLTSEEVSNLMNILEEFEAEIGLNVSKLRYLQTARELHLLTEKDFWIWFDLTHDTKAQIAKLKDGAVELDLYTKDYEYIDLRIPGQGNQRIFYMER